VTPTNTICSRLVRSISVAPSASLYGVDMISLLHLTLVLNR
jgi:hypothetical protein